METTKNKSNSKAKALLAIIGTLSTCVFLSCLVFHLSPLGMFEFLADYAAHHYFVFGFFSFLIAVGSYRLYTLWDESIDRRYHKKHPVYTITRERKSDL